MSRAALVGLMLSASAGAQTVEVLRDTGASFNRIDLVIVGDGYRSQDQSKLTADATALTNAILSFEPYARFAPVVNVKLIHADSNETGADNGSYGPMRDTRYGSYFNCGGVQRLLCFNTGTVVTDLYALTPEFDVSIVLVNDPMYGGSGGSTVAGSLHASSIEIMRHELGHSIARLADEYTSPYPAYPACSPSTDCFEPNATLRNTLAELKWSAWVPSGTPLPTPANAGFTQPGLFEGARYLTAGVYRPVDRACLMNVLNQPFCPVCSEGVVLAMANTISFLEEVTPDAGTLTVCDSLPSVRFESRLVPLTTLTLARRWWLDGALVADGGSLVVPLLGWDGGARSVRLEVEATTPLVRVDRRGVLRESAEWTLQRISCDDAGRPLDAGSPDAGLDASVTMDAGAVDAGRDAGQPDAGAGNAGHADAGHADAGQADAGLSDAGHADDAGGSRGDDAGQGDAGVPMPPTRAVGSCGCSVESSVAAVCVAVMLRRRRRR